MRVKDIDSFFQAILHKYDAAAAAKIYRTLFSPVLLCNADDVEG